jgi:hypothetical protein
VSRKRIEQIHHPLDYLNGGFCFRGRQGGMLRMVCKKFYMMKFCRATRRRRNGASLCGHSRARRRHSFCR